MAASLAACGGGGSAGGGSDPTVGGDLTNYRFSGASGTSRVVGETIDTTLDDIETSDGGSMTGGSFGFALGTEEGLGIVALSGFDLTSNMGLAPASDNVMFSGQAEFGKATNIPGSGPVVIAVDDSGTVPIDLTINFLSGTFSGGGFNFAHTLNLSGTISNGTLSGTVILDGIQGTLDGVAGQNGAVGAFHGGGTDTLPVSQMGEGNVVYAGGFVAD